MTTSEDISEARIPSPLQAFGFWAAVIAAALAAGTASALAAAYSVAHPGEDPFVILADPARSPLLNDPTWITLGTLGNELAVLTALAVFVAWQRPSSRLVFPLGSPSLWAVLGSVLLVFGLAPTAEVLAELVRRGLGAEVTSATVVIAAAKGADTVGLVLLLLVVALVPAGVEEAVFRGVVTSAFARRPWLAVVVPSVLFGAFHLEPTQAAGTMLLGVGFGVARVYSGSLLPPMIAHATYNAAVILSIRHGPAEPSHEIQPMVVLAGLAIAAGGYALLARERGGRLSSPARARTPPPPPA